MRVPTEDKHATHDGDCLVELQCEKASWKSNLPCDVWHVRGKLFFRFWTAVLDLIVCRDVILAATVKL